MLTSERTRRRAAASAVSGGVLTLVPGIGSLVVGIRRYTGGYPRWGLFMITVGVACIVWAIALAALRLRRLRGTD